MLAALRPYIECIENKTHTRVHRYVTKAGGTKRQVKRRCVSVHGGTQEVPETEKDGIIHTLEEVQLGGERVSELESHSPGFFQQR